MVYRSLHQLDPEDLPLIQVIFLKVQVPFGNTSPLVMDNAAKATFTVNFKRKVKVDTHIGVEDAVWFSLVISKKL